MGSNVAVSAPKRRSYLPALEGARLPRRRRLFSIGNGGARRRRPALHAVGGRGGDDDQSRRACVAAPPRRRAACGRALRHRDSVRPGSVSRPPAAVFVQPTPRMCSRNCAAPLAAAPPTIPASPTSASKRTRVCSGRVRRVGHPGTPRLFADAFPTESKRARFHAVSHRSIGEENDDRNYPLYLTTGRILAQYQSGTQTRRVGALHDMACEPIAGVHPLDSVVARRLGRRDRVMLTTDVASAAFVVKTDVDRSGRHGVRAVSLGRHAIDKSADQRGA